MDGAISASASPQQRRSTLGVSALRSTEAENDVSSGLFEQILSLSFDSSSEFEPNEWRNVDASAADEEVDASRDSHRKGSENPDSDDDEESDDGKTNAVAVSVLTELQTPVEKETPRATPTLTESVATEETGQAGSGTQTSPQLAAEPVDGGASTEPLQQSTADIENQTQTNVDAAAASAEEQTETPEVLRATEPAERSSRGERTDENADNAAARVAIAPNAEKTEGANNDLSDSADSLGENKGGATLQRTAEQDAEQDQHPQRESQDKWFQRDSNASAAADSSDSIESAHSSVSAGEQTTASQPATAELHSLKSETLVFAKPAETPPTTSPETTLVGVASAAAASSTRTDTLVQARLGGEGGTPSTTGVVGGESTRATAAANSRGKSSAMQNGGSGLDELTQQQQIRLVQRISRSFSRLTAEGGEINLRLHPPQLGSLNVRVRLEGSSMTAKLTTESAAAREAILESLPILRGRLAEQGFEISQFQVEVANNGSDAAGGENSGQQFTQADRDNNARLRNYQATTAHRGGRDSDSDAFAEPPEALSWQTTTGLDLHA